MSSGEIWGDFNTILSLWLLFSFWRQHIFMLGLKKWEGWREKCTHQITLPCKTIWTAEVWALQLHHSAVRKTKVSIVHFSVFHNMILRVKWDLPLFYLKELLFLFYFLRWLLKIYILLIMLLQLSHFPPFIPFCPAHLLPPAFPHFSSCPWVIHTSSLAFTFPILFLTSPCLFSTYHLCYLFSVPFPLFPRHTLLLITLHVISISVVLFLF